jgi:hypothetical protein
MAVEFFDKIEESVLNPMKSGIAATLAPLNKYFRTIKVRTEVIGELDAKNNPIDGNGGRWIGERGDGLWVPDNKEMLSKYGIDGIRYKDGQPDFSAVRKGDLVRIKGFSVNRAQNFAKADAAYAKANGLTPEAVKAMRKNDGYTWHENPDFTMELVPREVHEAATHRGGISVLKEMTERLTKQAEETTFKQKAVVANDIALKSGLNAMALTAAVSTIDNVVKVVKGEETAQEALIDIGKDTGVAGAVGYGTTFISSVAASAMKESSHALIRTLGNLGNGCVPAAVVSFGVSIFDDAVSLAKGELDGKQFAENIGGDAASVAGGVIGGALAGAALGSVVPGAGTAAGFAVGLVGGMVGTALASAAYASAIETAKEYAPLLADKAQEAADSVVKLVKTEIPDKLHEVKLAFRQLADENNLPLRV